MESRPPATHGSEAGHESRDASVRTLIYWGIGLAVFLAAGFVAAYVTYQYYTARQNPGPPASPFETNVRTLPPAPRLQVNAPADLKQYLDRQNSVLDTYGWVNKDQGIVRIPIDRAMDLLIQRNLLHVRSSPPATLWVASNRRSRRGPEKRPSDKPSSSRPGGGTTGVAARLRR